MNRDDNEFLTRVEGDAPMGVYLRENHWVPAVRSAKLVAGAPPERVRLFGMDFIAFRLNDGSVGFLDEACPHRRASLMLAHNDGDGLRCIFHGWKFDAQSKVLECPTQTNNPEDFARQVPEIHHPVREAGGIVWVWLGNRQKPGPFPNLEFLGLASEQVCVASSVVNCNWLQGVEVSIDHVHVGILHQAFVGRMTGYAPLYRQPPARYEVKSEDYGFRTAAIRHLPDEQAHVRVAEFVLPWFGFTAPNDPSQSDRQCFIAVPVDDTHTKQWFLRFNTKGPAETGFGFKLDSYDPDNLTPINGTAENAWGQDREAVRNGHFTGFPSSALVEDMVVQISMGSITARDREFLSDSDLGIVHARRLLLKRAKDFQRGALEAAKPIDYSKIRTASGVIPRQSDWRIVLPGDSADPQSRETGNR